MHVIRCLLCFFIVSFSKDVYSQNKLALPSANNAFSGNTGSEEVSVDLYTGTASVNVPVVSLPTQTGTVPVYLQYIGGRGIKVQDYAGEVGLGWKLIAGGSITRIVRGFPDEHHGTTQSNYSLNGGYLNGKVGAVNVATYIKNSYTNIILGSMIPEMILNTASSPISIPKIDSEPDLFMLNTPTVSVKFTFDENGMPVFQTWGTDVKIVHSNFFPASNGNSSFRVLDGHGKEYYFGSTAASREEHTAKLNDVNTTFISTWYLDKMVDLSTGDAVTFDYVSGYSVNVSSYHWTGYRRTAGYNGPVEASSVSGPTATTTTIHPKYISKITSKWGKVEFGYELPFTRSDFSVYKGLTSIKLIKGVGDILKEFRFTYQNSSRLMLSAIEEYNFKNATSWPYRQFTYHSRSLPARSSHHQDFFGYYSSQAVRTLNEVIFSAGLYREASSNPDYAKSMILTKVKYPTGLEVSIDYEMNQFFSTKGNRYGGGLRVKSVSSSSLPEGTLTTNYIYTFSDESSGKVLTESFDNLAYSYETIIMFAGRKTHTHYFSHIPTILHDLNGVFLGYSKVKVVSPTNDYSIYYFSNHDTDEDNYSYQDMINMSFYGYTHEWSGGYQTIYSSVSRATRRGHPLKVENYSRENRLLSSVENEYANSQFNALQSFGVTAYFYSADMYSEVIRTVYYTRPEFFHLVKTITKEYVENNKPLISTVDYEYSSSIMLRKRTTTNSEGQNLSETYYYSRDSHVIPGLPVAERDTLNELMADFNLRSLLVRTIAQNHTTGKKSESQIVYNVRGLPKKEKGFRNNILVNEVDYTYESGGLLSSDKEQRGILNSYGYDVTGAMAVKINNAQSLYPSHVTSRPTKYYEFFYNGFDGWMGGHNVTYSGNGSVATPYTVPFIKPNNRSYLIDYRYYQGGKWHYVKKVYTNALVINEGTFVDQVRVYPEDATITTYTYEPLRGMTSETDVNGITVFYVYDGIGRLSHTKDKDGNIIKSYCYNYAGQQVNCYTIDYVPPPPVLEIIHDSGKHLATIKLGSSNPDDYSFTSFEPVEFGLSSTGDFIAHNFFYSHTVAQTNIDYWSGYQGLELYDANGGFISTDNTLDPNKEYKYMYRYLPWSNWDGGWIWEIGTFTGLSEFRVDFTEPVTIDDFMVFPMLSTGVMYIYDEDDNIMETIEFL